MEELSPPEKKLNDKFRHVRTALRTLEREERQCEAKLAALRTAIDEGDASGIAKGDAFDRVRKTLNLRTKRG